MSPARERRETNNLAYNRRFCLAAIDKTAELPAEFDPLLLFAVVCN